MGGRRRKGLGSLGLVEWDPNEWDPEEWGRARGLQLKESSSAVGANRLHRVCLRLHLWIGAGPLVVQHDRAQVKAEGVALARRAPSFGHVCGVEIYRVAPIEWRDEAKSPVNIVGMNGSVQGTWASEKIQRLPQRIHAVAAQRAAQPRCGATPRAQCCHAGGMWRVILRIHAVAAQRAAQPRCSATLRAQCCLTGGTWRVTPGVRYMPRSDRAPFASRCLPAQGLLAGTAPAPPGPPKQQTGDAGTESSAMAVSHLARMCRGDAISSSRQPRLAGWLVGTCHNMLHAFVPTALAVPVPPTISTESMGGWSKSGRNLEPRLIHSGQ